MIWRKTLNRSSYLNGYKKHPIPNVTKYSRWRSKTDHDLILTIEHLNPTGDFYTIHSYKIAGSGTIEKKYLWYYFEPLPNE